MPLKPENPCADGHPELKLMIEVTTFSDRLPVMHCNRCGESLSFEEAVRNDERLRWRVRVPYMELTKQEREAVHDWCALHDIDHTSVPIEARIERDPITGDWLVEAFEGAKRGKVTLRRPFRGQLPWPTRPLTQRSAKINLTLDVQADTYVEAPDAQS